MINSTDKQHSQQREPKGDVIIITGEEGHGQNIVAMMHIGQALQDGNTPFHNGCSNRGFCIRPELLADEEEFVELIDTIPDRSTIVIADADCFEAINYRTSVIDHRWLHHCKAKEHRVVLTTVRGVEHKIIGLLEDAETTHIYVSSPQDLRGIVLSVSSGAMKERMPTKWAVLDEEETISLAKLTNGLYESPSRARDELIVSPIKSVALRVDYSDAVRSTTTARPKHPANSILLTKIKRYLEQLQHKTTEIISLPWLEAVNKQRDEEMAVRIIEWACELWGIDLQKITMNPSTTYPDAWAHHDGRKVNLEVMKIQPKWTNGATLAALADIIRSGDAVEPQESPIVQCKECGTWEDNIITDVHVLPEHDINHEWVCTYPKSMIGPPWTEHLTALPDLLIKPGDLRASVRKAVKKKDDLSKRFGEGNQNWLILSIEGFPLDEKLHDELGNIEWKDLDSVFLILTNQFGSAIYMNQIDDNRIIVNARCPKVNAHLCYHPGIRTSVRKAGSASQSLREETFSKGLVYQVVNADGKVLAEEEIEFQLPISQDDTQKGVMGAVKKLPFQPSENVFK